MPDELGRIEDSKAQIDMGVMLARVYAGALDESGSRRDALWVTVAYMIAMIKGNQEDE